MKLDLNWLGDGGRLRLSSLLNSLGVYAQALGARAAPLLSPLLAPLVAKLQRIPTPGLGLPRLALPSPLMVAWVLLAAGVLLAVVALATFDHDESDAVSLAAVAALPAPDPAAAAPEPEPAPPTWRLNARPIAAVDSRPRLAVMSVWGLRSKPPRRPSACRRTSRSPSFPMAAM